MAYHSTSGTASNTADFLVRLKDFLVGTVGWTLRDDRSGDAEPSYVLASAGESGAEDIFLRFVNDTPADRIAVRAYLYWDAATHAGVKEAFNTSYTYIKTVDASAFLYWIYADMDHVFIVTKIAAVYYAHYCGILKRFCSGAVAVTQAAASPGSGVTLQVNDASIFRVGGYYLTRTTRESNASATAVDTVASPTPSPWRASSQPMRWERRSARTRSRSSSVTTSPGQLLRLTSSTAGRARPVRPVRAVLPMVDSKQPAILTSARGSSRCFRGSRPIRRRLTRSCGAN